MRPRSLLAILAGFCLVATGCTWIQKRSDFDRDPFVMSHLTHHKNDPLYAGTENENSFDDERPLRAAAVSRKTDTRTGSSGDYRPMSYRENAPEAEPTRADDFRWVEGTLERDRKSKGWSLRYANDRAPDAHGGALRLADSPRLGLAREGDRVRLEGRLTGQGTAGERYRIDSLTVLDP